MARDFCYPRYFRSVLDVSYFIWYPNDNRNSTWRDNRKMAEQEQEVNGDPMLLGCFLFAGPFALMVAWMILAVVFDWRV